MHATAVEDKYFALMAIDSPKRQTKPADLNSFPVTVTALPPNLLPLLGLRPATRATGRYSNGAGLLSTPPAVKMTEVIHGRDTGCVTRGTVQ
jgi:hypothetical protein